MPINSFENYYLSWKPQKERLVKPFFLSLANMLESDIHTGTLPGGTKLPPQRELADFLDIHFTTVTRAYEECKKRNLIYGMVGSGTFVSPQAVSPITNSMDNLLNDKKKMSNCNTIEMGFVSSFEETNSIVANYLPKIICNSNIIANLNYNSPTGQERHKEIALKWMSQFGINAPISQTAIVSGSMNALTICFLSLFKPGNRIAVDYYINNNVIELAKLLHLQLIPIKMDLDGMIPDCLEQICQQTNINGIYLTPSCNNPTTIHTTITRKFALSKVIKKHNLIVLEDDHYAFSTAENTSVRDIPLREMIPDQTVYICNTTTSICSGLRIAFLVFPYRYLDAIYSAICNINVKTSSLEAEIICSMIESGLARDIANKKMSLAKTANDIFNDIFPDNYCGHPFSFFRWLTIPVDRKKDPVGWELLSKGVHIYHSRRFICGKEEDNSYLRIALSSVGSEEQLRFGLLKIKEHLFK